MNSENPRQSDGRKQKPITSSGQIAHSHIRPNAAARPNLDTSAFVSTMLFGALSRQKGSKLPNKFIINYLHIEAAAWAKPSRSQAGAKP
jgi:hypothetical protein